MFKMISLLIFVYIIIINQLLKVIFTLSSIIYIKVSEYHFSNKAVELQIPNIIVQQPGGWEMALGWGGQNKVGLHHGWTASPLKLT
jgi:hypothetical protein